MTTDSAATDSTAIVDARIIDTQRCPACGAINNCAIAQGAEQCWCMVEPVGAALPASSAASCYCRDCLRALSSIKNPAKG